MPRKLDKEENTAINQIISSSSSMHASLVQRSKNLKKWAILLAN